MTETKKEYDKSLAPVHGSRINDYSSFFLNLNRYLKYFNIGEINETSKVLDCGSADNTMEKAFKIYKINVTSFNDNNCNFESDNLPFPNETFDFVLFTAVIEHLYNPTKILNEIKRILKKEGIIIISTTNYNHQVKEFWNDPTHKHPYNPISLEKLLTLHNYKKIKITPFLYNKPSFYWKLPYWIVSKIPFKNHTFKYLPIPKFLRGHSTMMLATAFK